MKTESTPAVVTIDMGYGHMRAARPLADMLGSTMLQVDKPPLSELREQVQWQKVRGTYEAVSRWSQVPVIGRPFRFLLDTATQIPHLYPYRDLSQRDLSVRAMEGMVEKGLGEGLMAHLRSTGQPLLTTFYAPALIADHHRFEKVFCVVTDSDIHRIWAPLKPHDSRIVYLTPSRRAAQRLRLYGVDDERIHQTGFPLPDELVGGTELELLKKNLRSRLVRLDPTGDFRSAYRDELSHFLGDVEDDGSGQAPLLTFAVGGAGAQSSMAELMLPSLRDSIRSKALRVALVAGTRESVRRYFLDKVAEAGLEASLGDGIEVLHEESFDAYYGAFNELLARTDILYTKPSELTFYAALGLPIVCARPVGHHERINRRYLLEAGAGLKQWDPKYAGVWLKEWLDDGTLAAAAWSGYMRLPKTGTYRILELAGREPSGPSSKSVKALGRKSSVRVRSR